VVRARVAAQAKCGRAPITKPRPAYSPSSAVPTKRWPNTSAHSRSIPAMPKAAWNLALLQMLTGDFENGPGGPRDPLGNSRNSRPAYPKPARADVASAPSRSTARPSWSAPRRGWATTIQHARYLPMLAAAGRPASSSWVEPGLCPAACGREGCGAVLCRSWKSTVLAVLRLSYSRQLPAARLRPRG